jgi:hypothetical protein
MPAHISGRIAQGDVRFGQLANKQCMCIATYAILSASRTEITTADSVDKIVVSGSAYYGFCSGNLPPGQIYLNVDELEKSFLLDGHLIAFDTIDVSAGVILEDSFERQSAFMAAVVAAFQRTDCEGYLLTSHLRTVAFWARNDAYYLFNSHAVDMTGQEFVNGKARLFRFETMHELSKALLLNRPFNSRDWFKNAFEIVGLRLTTPRLPASETEPSDIVQIPVSTKGSSSPVVTRAMRSPGRPAKAKRGRPKHRPVEHCGDATVAECNANSHHLMKTDIALPVSSESENSTAVEVSNAVENVNTVELCFSHAAISEPSSILQNVAVDVVKMKRGRPRRRSVERAQQKKQSTLTHLDSTRKSKREYAQRNRKTVRASQKRYVQRNPAAVQAAQAQYSAQRPRALKSAQAKYLAQRPAARKNAQAKYLARRPSAPRNAQAKYLARRPSALKSAQAKYFAQRPTAFMTAKKRYASMNAERFKTARQQYNYRNAVFIRMLRKKYERIRKVRQSYSEREKRRIRKNIPQAFRLMQCMATTQGDQLAAIKPLRLRVLSLLSDQAAVCKWCKSRLFYEERDSKNWCCGCNRYTRCLQPLGAGFYSDKEFLRHVRAYNNLFAFTALGVTRGFQGPPGGRGVSFLKIQGRMYHRYFNANYSDSTNNTALYINDPRERERLALGMDLGPAIPAGFAIPGFRDWIFANPGIPGLIPGSRSVLLMPVNGVIFHKPRYECIPNII